MVGVGGLVSGAVRWRSISCPTVDLTGLSVPSMLAERVVHKTSVFLTLSDQH